MKVDSVGRIVALCQSNLENELWVIEADGSVSEMLATQDADLDGAKRFFFQEDGKLIVLVGAEFPGITQPHPPAKLIRLHYEDEGKSADLRIDTTGIIPPRNVGPGDEIEYTIRVANNGKNKAAHLTFENSLPNGTTFVSLEAPDGWVTYQLRSLSSARCRVLATALQPVRA